MTTGHFHASRYKLTELALDCNFASSPYGASGLRVGVDGAPLKLLTHITLIGSHPSIHGLAYSGCQGHVLAFLQSSARRLPMPLYSNTAGALTVAGLC